MIYFMLQNKMCKYLQPVNWKPTKKTSDFKTTEPGVQKC